MVLTTRPAAAGPTAPARSGHARIGLDVGASKVHGVALVDGTVRAEHRVPTSPGVDGVVDSVVAAVLGLGAALGDGGRAADDGWAGIGVGVPGIVDPGAGTVAHAVNLGVVAVEPLAARLADRLDAPVVVENDLNAAALGAAHLLGLDGDLAYLALGTGVAAGLLLGGRLRRGHSGAAGEIGHVPYRPSGPRCPCGQTGCLELYASGSALDAAWPTTDGVPAPAAVFARAEEGDAAAVALRDDFVDAVTTAVQTLVLTTDVAHVVLGGGVAEVGAPLLDGVTAVLRRRVASSPFLAALDLPGRVGLAPPGGLVAPVGAALLVGAEVG